MSGARRIRALGALVALVALLVGCQGDATVLVAANDKGAGRVRVDVALDRAAAQGLGDPAKALSSADLSARGWATEGVRVATDGTAKFAVEKSFRNVAEANAILDELTGPKGPFRGVRLRRRATPMATELSLRGNLDLTKGPEILGDSGLAALTGSTSLLGFDPASVVAAEGKPIEQIVTVQVRAELPNAAQTWKAPFGASTAIALASRTRTWGVPVGVAAVVLGLAAVVFGLRAARTPKLPDTPRP